MCSPRVAAASCAGTSANPSRLNCQARSAAPPFLAIRREISVATEPVMRRLGPIAVARMPAQSPLALPGAIAAAAGRLLAVEASRVALVSWRVKLPCSARLVPSSGGGVGPVASVSQAPNRRASA